jgi:hypothetical protein
MASEGHHVVEIHATAYNCYAVVTQQSESFTNAQMDFGILGIADGQQHNENVSLRRISIIGTNTP